MVPTVCLVQKPSIDFDSLIGIGNEVLGYSPATAADQEPRRLSQTEKFLSCLASFNSQSAPVGLSPHLLGHSSFSVLVCAAERDLIDILEVASGMSFVTGDTIMRGAMVAVITGNLTQWRDAVVSGLDSQQDLVVRGCYALLLNIFDDEGLTPVWSAFDRRTSDQGLPLLTHKRR